MEPPEAEELLHVGAEQASDDEETGLMTSDDRDSDEDDSEVAPEDAAGPEPEGAGDFQTGVGWKSSRNRHPPSRWEGEFSQEKLSEVKVPMSCAEAIASPQALFWVAAMEDEMASLQMYDTWDLVPLPKDTKAVNCRWVFTLKTDASGGVEKFKAQLVAKGFSQVPGVDYGEVYAPGSKFTTLHALLATLALKDMELVQLDVKTAFLNGSLEEEVFMEQPPRYQVRDQVQTQEGDLWLKEGTTAVVPKAQRGTRGAGIQAFERRCQSLYRTLR